MKRRTRFTSIPLLATLVLFIGCGGSSAPKATTTPTPDVPDAPTLTAETVLDRYVEVTGGEAAYKAIKSAKVTGVMEFVGAPVKGNLEIVNAGDKFAVQIDITSLGKIRMGSDGTTVWSADPMSGARILNGVERSQMLRSNDLLGAVRWRQHYKSSELKGVEEIDGKKVQVIALIDVDGIPETRYYDVATGYLLKTKSVVKAQTGDVPAVVINHEYAEFSGIKIPVKQTMTQGPQSFTITMNNFEANPTIDPAAFALPADIKKLVEAKAAE